MIVTVQFVFCFLKEVFQSLLLKYHEGHSGDDERMVEDVINEEGGQSIVDLKTVHFYNLFRATLLLYLH